MSNKIHSFPILCFTQDKFDINSNIMVSKDINEVTCPYCIYYWFKPLARKLELEFREKYNVST